MSKRLVVSQEDAVAICLELGYHTASQWKRKKMASMLIEIVRDKDEEEGMTVSGDLGRVFDAIVAAGGEVELTADGETELPEDREKAAEAVEGESVEDTKEEETQDDDSEPNVAEDEPDPEPEPAEDAKPEKKPKDKRGRPKGSKNKVKKDAEPKEKVKTKVKDRFGNREGTKAAKFCACLSKKAKSMKELMEEAKDKGAQYNLMRKLVGEGVVVKEERKYRLA